MWDLSITQQYLKMMFDKGWSKLHVLPSWHNHTNPVKHYHHTFGWKPDDGHIRLKRSLLHPLLNIFFRYCCVIDWYPHLLFIWAVLATLLERGRSYWGYPLLHLPTEVQLSGTGHITHCSVWCTISACHLRSESKDISNLFFHLWTFSSYFV